MTKVFPLLLESLTLMLSKKNLLKINRKGIKILRVSRQQQLRKNNKMSNKFWTDYFNLPKQPNTILNLLANK